MTDAAWRRALDGLDQEEFGRLVADEVIRATQPGAHPEDQAALRDLLGMGAAEALRRLVQAAELETLTGDQLEDDEALGALASTIQLVRSARDCLAHEDEGRALELLDQLVAAWDRNLT